MPCRQARSRGDAARRHPLGPRLRGLPGLFFYFTTPDEGDGTVVSARRHFWRYYDLITDRILDNRYEIARLIRCGPDQPRVIGEVNASNGTSRSVFEIQEHVIDHILEAVRDRQAVAIAPKILDPLQQMVATVLQQQRNNAAVAWRELKGVLEALRTPLAGAYLRDLREAYDTYQKDQDVAALLASVQSLTADAGPEPETLPETRAAPHREDLHLVCWEYVWA